MKHTRKLYETAKAELIEKAQSLEIIENENSRLKAKLDKLANSGLLQQDALRLAKNVDFGEDTIIQSENSARSDQSEGSKFSEWVQPIREQDSFTSNNLRFLRERLAELRQKNENLQKRYNQVQTNLQESGAESQEPERGQRSNRHKEESFSELKFWYFREQTKFSRGSFVCQMT